MTSWSHQRSELLFPAGGSELRLLLFYQLFGAVSHSPLHCPAYVQLEQEPTVFYLIDAEKVFELDGEMQLRYVYFTMD